MEQSYYITILAIIIGWLLSESSHYFRRWQDKRSAINKALSDLLEIRHGIKGNQLLIEMMEKRLNFKPIVIHAIKREMPSPLKKDPELKKRFNEAVDAISSYDPFLSYSLRAKDIVSVFEDYFNPKEIADEEYAQYLIDTYKKLNENILPHLEEILTDIARKVSFRCYLKMKKLLSKTEQPSDEVIKMMNHFENITKEALKKDKELLTN